MTAEFKKRPYELRVDIANNNAEVTADLYAGLKRVRKGDGIKVDKTTIQGTTTTVTPKV